MAARLMYSILFMTLFLSVPLVDGRCSCLKHQQLVNALGTQHHAKPCNCLKPSGCAAPQVAQPQPTVAPEQEQKLTGVPTAPVVQAVSTESVPVQAIAPLAAPIESVTVEEQRPECGALESEHVIVQQPTVENFLLSY